MRLIDELTLADAIYCLKAESGINGEVCERCRLYKDCSYDLRNDVYELAIRTLIREAKREAKNG